MQMMCVGQNDSEYKRYCNLHGGWNNTGSRL